MKTCPDCGERVYKLGCVNCNEAAYIDEQEVLTHIIEDERRRDGGRDSEPVSEWAGYPLAWEDEG